MPVGNTTMIDPTKSGKGPVVPLPAAPPPPPKPDVQAGVASCTSRRCRTSTPTRAGDRSSIPAEAEQLGIEGDVKLRVELDDKGKVHGIKVLSGLGHGLDQAAVYALTHNAASSRRPSPPTASRSRT